MLYLITLLLAAGAVWTWDCEYELGKVYQYHYTSELINTVPDKQSAPSTNHGIILSGVVTLIPLAMQTDMFYIEVYIESIQQQNIDTLYSHVLDHSKFAALFLVSSDTFRIPRDQTGYESNVLRAVISALKIKSCQQTGVYTADEVTVAGRHTSTYESNRVDTLMFDGHILYPSEDSIDDWYAESTNNIDVIRRVENINIAEFTGSTTHQHKQYLGDMMTKGTTVEYSYLIGSLNIVQNCVFYEKYSPKHMTGYATTTEVSIRTSLNLVASTIDPDSTYQFSNRELIELKLHGKDLKQVSLVMEFIEPDLRPSLNFEESGETLRELILNGYDSTSTEILKTWLYFIRNIYVGVGSDEGRQEFARVRDVKLLPWFIDAANVNGTAQLHLLAHNSIKSLRALKLTERFIGSKQFTTEPPTRMLKWLLKTCEIDRYEKSCALAVASSATSTYLAQNGRSNIVTDIFEFLTTHITNSVELEEKVFYVTTLGNMKLPEATRYLLDLALDDKTPEVRKAAVETLHFHSPSEVTFEDRLGLLDKALEEDNYGAPALHYVLSSSPHHTLHQLIQYTSSRICSEQTHHLSRFFLKTLGSLSDSRTDSVRANIVRDELIRLRSDTTCRLCADLSAESEYDSIARDYIFGSAISGAELEFERFGGNGISGGSTKLSLKFLEAFGLNTDIVQTSLDLPTVENFLNDLEQGQLNIAVNGQRIKSTPFKIGDIEEVDTNILLSDITVLIPTLSGLPLSYSVGGSLRTTSAVRSDQFPKITLDNDVGIYLETGFKLSGAGLGWATKTEFHTEYQDVLEFKDDISNKHTIVENLSFKTDSTLPSEWSSVADIAHFFKPMVFLNSSFLTTPDLESTSDAPLCETIEEEMLSVTFENNKIHSFDPKSFLGRWIIEENFSNIDQNHVYELSQFDCRKKRPFEGLVITDEEHSTYTVQVQSLHGVLSVGNHERVESLGDSTQRNLRLTGSRDDLMLVLENLTYFTPSDYSGPELITLSVEQDGVPVTVSLILYVTGTCL
ncbi:uncharacterized protein LOC134824872 [Bolinopsis microptera]|uniref:uncharacterized protein LOC134824872 n=1 Tax=Bolinopsis microptera TaxID=2820187 RepID=UPI00307A1F36